MTSPAFRYTTDRVTIYPPTLSGGPDRRINVYDNRDHQFHRSVSTGGQQAMTAVEVQAFTPDQFRNAVVALVTFISEGENNLSGQSDLLLSPVEARAIANMLIVAAAEAEAQDESARQARVATEVPA